MLKRVEVGEAVVEEEEEETQWQNKQQLLLDLEAWLKSLLMLLVHDMSSEEGEVTGKILSWRGVCAKKHTFLLQFLPSLQASVLYLAGCSQHSNTP